MVNSLRYFCIIFICSFFITGFSEKNKVVKKAEPAIKVADKGEAKKEPRSNLSCKYIFLIMKAMLRQHMLYDDFDLNIEKRSIEQYVKSLDPLKTYLHQQDVNKIKSKLRNMKKWLGGQSCSPLKDVKKIVENRIQERKEFSAKYLGKDFKIDKSISLILDSEKRSYSKNIKELNEFHSKHLQFQVANFTSSDMKLEEAKGHVVRRYERAHRRYKEQLDEDVYSSFLNSFAGALDPHSSYLSVDDLEDFNIQMQLSLEGIGATLSTQDGYTVIENLIHGGAAESSGELESQDKIIAVAQAKGTFESVIDLPLRDVVQKIRGPKGTKVRLSILRKTPDGTKSFKVELIRKKISLEDEAAQAHYIERKIDGVKYNLAIINLPSFYHDSRKNGRSSYKDVRRILKEINEKKNVSGVVLDLSTNGGGSLDDAVKMAGLFFKTGNVVKTKGASTTPEEVLADKDPTVNYTGPMVILTSRLSASASEIVSGALKDYKRAVVVGADHTFGKGSVQTVLPLPQKLGAYKVTVGMFFVPGGKSTQHGGVDGDIILPSPYSNDDIGEKTLDYSLPPKKIARFTSMDAYVNKGSSKWLKVNDNTINLLKNNSKKRVSKNKDFIKIIDEIKKSEEKSKVVKVAEILESSDKKKEAKEKRKRKNDPKKRIADYLKRADINEAAAVLTDLVNYQKTNKIAQKK